MTVNERIKKELQIRGWSQYHLAKLTHIGQSTICKWFSFVPTTPSHNSLKKVAKAFSMDIGELMSDSKEKDPLTQELSENWNRLNDDEKQNVLNIIKTIVSHH